MDVLLHSLSVCEYKTYPPPPKKIYIHMPILGRELTQFVSEQYCYHVNGLCYACHM